MSQKHSSTMYEIADRITGHYVKRIIPEETKILHNLTQLLYYKTDLIETENSIVVRRYEVK